jgi:hypothetical protein
MSPVSFLFQWITIHNNFFATKISWANFCCEKKYYSRIIARKGAGKGILLSKSRRMVEGSFDKRRWRSHDAKSVGAIY